MGRKKDNGLPKESVVVFGVHPSVFQLSRG